MNLNDIVIWNCYYLDKFKNYTYTTVCLIWFLSLFVVWTYWIQSLAIRNDVYKICCVCYLQNILDYPFVIHIVMKQWIWHGKIIIMTHLVQRIDFLFVLRFNLWDFDVYTLVNSIVKFSIL